MVIPLQRLDFPDGKEVMCLRYRLRMEAPSLNVQTFKGRVCFEMDCPFGWLLNLEEASRGEPEGRCLCYRSRVRGLPSLEHTNRRLRVREALRYGIGLTVYQLEMSFLGYSYPIEDEPDSCPVEDRPSGR